MLVAGEKAQLLVPSQYAARPQGIHHRSRGKTVSADDHLKFPGVTLDRLLHFGAHCRNLRVRARCSSDG